MFTKVVVSILAIQYFLFCYREGSVAECYLLCTFCFLQEQFRNVWRLLNGKNKVIVSQLFFRNSYFVVYCIVLHCSNQYTLYNSLHHPGSLRDVLFGSLWWLQLPGSPCAKSGDSLSCESFHYSGSIVNYTFIVHSNRP